MRKLEVRTLEENLEQWNNEPFVQTMKYEASMQKMFFEERFRVWQGTFEGDESAWQILSFIIMSYYHTTNFELTFECR